MLKIIADTIIVFLITYALIDILTRCTHLLIKEEFIIKNGAIIVFLDDDISQAEAIIKKAVCIAEQERLKLVLLCDIKKEENNIFFDMLCEKYPYMYVCSCAQDSTKEIYENVFSKEP